MPLLRGVLAVLYLPFRGGLLDLLDACLSDVYCKSRRA